MERIPIGILENWCFELDLGANRFTCLKRVEVDFRIPAAAAQSLWPSYTHCCADCRCKRRPSTSSSSTSKLPRHSGLNMPQSLLASADEVIE